MREKISGNCQIVKHLKDSAFLYCKVLFSRKHMDAYERAGGIRVNCYMSGTHLTCVLIFECYMLKIVFWWSHYGYAVMSAKLAKSTRRKLPSVYSVACWEPEFSTAAICSLSETRSSLSSLQLNALHWEKIHSLFHFSSSHSLKIDPSTPSSHTLSIVISPG